MEAREGGSAARPGADHWPRAPPAFRAPRRPELQRSCEPSHILTPSLAVSSSPQVRCQEGASSPSRPLPTFFASTDLPARLRRSVLIELSTPAAHRRRRLVSSRSPTCFPRRFYRSDVCVRSSCSIISGATRTYVPPRPPLAWPCLRPRCATHLVQPHVAMLRRSRPAGS